MSDMWKKCDVIIFLEILLLTFESKPKVKMMST